MLYSPCDIDGGWNILFIDPITAVFLQVVDLSFNHHLYTPSLHETQPITSTKQVCIHYRAQCLPIPIALVPKPTRYIRSLSTKPSLTTRHPLISR